MKKQILRFGPLMLLMAVSTIAICRDGEYGSGVRRSIRTCTPLRMSCGGEK